jgi:hypothetical protein
MALPQFILDANTLTFEKGIKYPVRRPHEMVQALDRTAAGSLQVESFGIEIKRLVLRLEYISSSFYSSLLDWFENKCNGAANAFTYIDDQSVSHTVVWTNNFNFIETVAGYNGSIDLEIVA